MSGPGENYYYTMDDTTGLAYPIHKDRYEVSGSRVEENHGQIMDFINQFKRCVDNAEEIYQNGKCVQFAILLATLFNGRVYYDQNHAVFDCSNGNVYDITGVTMMPPGAEPIESFGVTFLNKILTQ